MKVTCNIGQYAQSNIYYTYNNITLPLVTQELDVNEGDVIYVDFMLPCSCIYEQLIVNYYQGKKYKQMFTLTRPEKGNNMTSQLLKLTVTKDTSINASVIESNSTGRYIKLIITEG